MIETTSVASFSVGVVDEDQRLRTRLAMQLGDTFRSASFASVEALEERLGSVSGAVVLIGPSCLEQDRLEAVERLTSTRPVGVILAVDEALPFDTFQRALRAGVKDVVTLPVETEQLLEAVQRVGATIAAPAVAAPAPNVAPVGKALTVFSAKGGAGKTVIATSLAVALAKRRPGEKVVVVDADLQFGDIAVMLKVAPQHTIVDAVTAFDRLDAQYVQDLLVRHEPSGVYVLAAPLEPAFADQISAAQMLRIIELLQETCAYVVIDTPAYFNEVVLALIERSDEVLLLAGMDIPNIKNTKISLQTLRMLNIPQSKVRLVLNRANSKVKLDVAEVERSLQVKAEVLVPSDVVVPQAVNKGVPVVMDAPKSGVAKSIEQLADLFEPTADKRRR